MVPAAWGPTDASQLSHPQDVMPEMVIPSLIRYPSPRWASAAARLAVGCLAIWLALAAWRPALALDARMADQAAKVGEIVRQAKDGQPITQTRLGWLVVDLLSDLGDRDPELADFLHHDSHFIETYLITVFQYNARREVAAVDALAAQRPSPVRRAARWALEALRHIPDSDDSAAAQAQDRGEMIAALEALEDQLRQAADAPLLLQPSSPAPATSGGFSRQTP